MGNTNDDTGHYEGALMEDINGKFDYLVEAISGMTVKVNSIDERLIRVERIVEPIPAMIATMTGHSGQLSDHELRITTLENA